MSRKLTRRAALGLIGAGAIGSVTWSGGFSQLRAGRNATVDTASDLDAYLGLEDLSNFDPVKITNQSGHEMEMTLSSPESSVEFDVFNDDTNDGANPDPFTIGIGATVEVDVLADGTFPVDFVATLLDSGSPIGEISLQRDVDAQSQAGQVSITPNVKPVGNSGMYEFELENTGTIDVSIDALGIRYTTNDNADEVSGGDILTVEGNPRLNSLIPFNSNDHSSANPQELTQDVPLITGEDAKTFEFDKFRTADGSNAKMQNNGDEVGIRLYFTDGSTLDEVLAP